MKEESFDLENWYKKILIHPNNPLKKDKIVNLAIEFMTML